MWCARRSGRWKNKYRRRQATVGGVYKRVYHIRLCAQMARSLIYAMYNQGRRSVLCQGKEILKHAGKALLAERIREMETSVFLSQKVGIIGPADGIS